MGISVVDGKDKGELFLFALSTCIWCRKMREHLNSLGVAYKYVYMDQVEGEEKEKFRKDLKKWNPDCSYPTLVLNDKKCLVGFDEDEINAELQ